MKSIDWGGENAIDPRFLIMVQNWIETDGEVYVRVYHAKSGNASDHWYFNTYTQFVQTVNSTWGNCKLEVYRHPNFPLRGFITEDFIARAKEEFAEGKDWFLLILEEENKGWKTLSAYGDNSHRELEVGLRGYQGKYAIIGPDIHWPIPPEDFPGDWIQANFDRYFRKDEIPII